MAQSSNRMVRTRAAMELKLSILTALNKLADRDTQQMATDDLQKIAETLPPEGVSVILNCLYDVASDQKMVVRRECVRLFSTLALVHGELLSPHLPKIVATIMRRIKDPDSHIRDACVDTMGILAARLSPSGASSDGNAAETTGLTGPLSAFTKPLFDTMNEQSKTAQCGAAMCLARVVESARDPSPGCFQRFLPRIVKFLCNPTFMAKAALLSVVGSLARVAGSTGNQYLVPLVPSVQDSLQSSDWATRKAAADTLTLLGLVLGPSLNKFKESTIAMLETYRFDKVKPVRDSMADAMQVWKNIPDSENDNFATKGISLNDAASISSSLQQVDLASPKSRHVTSETGFSSEKSASSECGLQNAQDKILANISRKKTPSLTDRKLNPDFFRKIESRNQDDWQIEVAVPRGSPSSVSNPPNKGMSEETIQAEANGEEGVMRANASGYTLRNRSVPVDGKENPEQCKRQEDDAYEATDSVKSNGTSEETAAFNFMRSAADPAQSNAWLRADFQQQQHAGNNQTWDSTVPSKNSSVLTQSGEHLTANSCEFVAIQRQLSQVEQEQCNLMDMVQDFIRNCQEGMLGLEARVQRLERAVEDMARNLATSRFSHVNSGNYVSLEAAAGCALPGNYIACSDPLSSRFQNTSENSASFPQRLLAYGGMTSVGRGGREFSSRTMEMGPEMWNDPAGRVLQTALTGQYRSENHSNLQRSHLMAFDDSIKDSRAIHIEGEPPLTRRTWERGSGSIRLGEGPSARSVWQASKDEATLAAIRVAGGDPRATILEIEKKSASNFGLNASERISEALQCQTAEPGNGSSWVLWSQVMEDLHLGDIDSAYEQVLCAGDELLLVRLMGKTGPVLDQLSGGTVSEVLHSVTLFVQQQSFLDCVLPWVQQVLDLIRTNGPDYLNVTTDIKKELVLALHEGSTMDHSESLLAITMLKLARKLGISWSIDSDRNSES
ncbi:hypothetical protein O6H91_10G073900 [Diphasiastrum complanatum]|uniref:Uncharacterized protein n=3 Tax=Diphasiastrum complanatum TaxID=34168 RepID=A0ACC2CIG0_DIPCM|nr:hypothetical protein O6H91_10G073900 [Diphasiastrum complanatum]KAJ7541736.1 hypothetical protein O6H91_10G073900 [Diphasiastrum complanatum]KAJ7541737.1 hypothetical protein O6H91_10G073900 [Diphasiastrum complanatum]